MRPALPAFVRKAAGSALVLAHLPAQRAIAYAPRAHHDRLAADSHGKLRMVVAAPRAASG